MEEHRVSCSGYPGSLKSDMARCVGALSGIACQSTFQPSIYCTGICEPRGRNPLTLTTTLTFPAPPPCAPLTGVPTLDIGAETLSLGLSVGLDAGLDAIPLKFAEDAVLGVHPFAPTTEEYGEGGASCDEIIDDVAEYGPAPGGMLV